MAAPIRATIQCKWLGRFQRTPIWIETYAPIIICPEAPILNNPVLNAKATAKPVNIIGAAPYNVFPIPTEPLFVPPSNNWIKAEPADDGLKNNITIKPITRPMETAINDGYILMINFLKDCPINRINFLNIFIIISFFSSRHI